MGTTVDKCMRFSIETHNKSGPRHPADIDAKSNTLATFYQFVSKTNKCCIFGHGFDSNLAPRFTYFEHNRVPQFFNKPIEFRGQRRGNFHWLPRQRMWKRHTVGVEEHTLQTPFCKRLIERKVP